MWGFIHAPGGQVGARIHEPQKVLDCWAASGEQSQAAPLLGGASRPSSRAGSTAPQCSNTRGLGHAAPQRRREPVKQAVTEPTLSVPSTPCAQSSTKLSGRRRLHWASDLEPDDSGAVRRCISGGEPRSLLDSLTSGAPPKSPMNAGLLQRANTHNNAMRVGTPTNASGMRVCTQNGGIGLARSRSCPHSNAFLAGSLGGRHGGACNSSSSNLACLYKPNASRRLRKGGSDGTDVACRLDASGKLRSANAPDSKWAVVPPHSANINHFPPAREAPVRSLSKYKKNKDIVFIGPHSAMEIDRRFQEELIQKWTRESQEEPSQLRINKRQLCQLFDFISEPSGERLREGTERYIREALGSFDSIEDEMYASAPEFDHQKQVELTKNQMAKMRQVLKAYSDMSRPSPLATDAIFRCCFCRFLIDSSLVQCDPENAPKDMSNIRYHYAVRLFDSVSKTPKEGGQRCATIDQCIVIITKTLPATSEAWLVFELGLDRAMGVMEALTNESRLIAQQQAEIALRENTEEANSLRRDATFGNHPYPPNSFQGTLKDWTLGLWDWVDTTQSNSTPESTAERAEQNFALECYLRDMLIEPGVIHVGLKCYGIFRALFNAYVDEEKTQREYLDYGSRSETLPHMSFAAFFRFCLDFSVFPTLCSFDKAWALYQSSDCAQPLSNLGERGSAKFREAAKRINLMGTIFSALSRRNSMAVQEIISRSSSKATSNASSQTYGSNSNSNEDSRTSSKRDPMRATIAVDGSNRFSSKQQLMPPTGIMRSRANSICSGSSDRGQRPVPRRNSSGTSVVFLAGARNSGFPPAWSGSDEASRSGATTPALTSARDEPAEEEVPVRVKTCTDFQWVHKQFRDMSALERQTYALLSAISDCVADRFLDVRGLFASVHTEGRRGFADAESVLTAFENLHVRHAFHTEEDMQNFINIVDPNADGFLDLCELEKAVEYVRQNKSKRWPSMSATCGTHGLGGTPLGERARNLGQNPDASFGPAAFMETLLLLGLNHMHSNGSAVKVSASGGVKAFWLLIFLQHRHAELLREYENGTLLPCDVHGPGAHVDAHSPKVPSALLDMMTRSDSKSKPRMASHPSSNKSSATGIPEDPVWKDPAWLQDTKNGARYTSTLERLLESRPDLFDNPPLPSGGVSIGVFDTSQIKLPGSEAASVGNIGSDLAGKVCGACGRTRDQRGIGSVFCHGCSGVDDVALAKSPLYPIFQRRRLQLKLVERALEQEQREQQLREQQLENLEGSLDSKSAS